MEYDRHRNLRDRDPGSDSFSFHGVLHGPTGRAARRCGYLLDCGFARAGRALLRICARVAASRAAAAYPAHLTPRARFRSVAWQIRFTACSDPRRCTEHERARCPGTWGALGELRATQSGQSNPPLSVTRIVSECPAKWAFSMFPTQFWSAEFRRGPRKRLRRCEYGMIGTCRAPSLLSCECYPT